MPTSHVPFFLHRLVPVIVLACSRTIFNIYMQSALYNLGPVGIDMLPQILWDQFLSEVYQPGMHDGHLHNVLFVARPLKQQRCHRSCDRRLQQGCLSPTRLVSLYRDWQLLVGN